MTSLDPAVRHLLTAQQAAALGSVQVGVQSKAIQAAEMQGEAMVQLLEQAAQFGRSLHTGSTFDAVG